MQCADIKRCHDGWAPLIEEQAECLNQIDRILAAEKGDVSPAPENVFRAFELDPLEVKVVLLGQDPYPGMGQADGLAFSVSAGSVLPYSLKRIRTTLREEGFQLTSGTDSLEAWHRRGVMLLNRILTVPCGRPLGHAACGWENFTTAVVKFLCEQPHPPVFLLLGKKAQRAIPTLNYHCCRYVDAPHPASRNGTFIESRPFSRVNEALDQYPVDWSL